MENLRADKPDARETQTDNENSGLVKKAARLIPSRAALQEEPSVIECRFPHPFDARLAALLHGSFFRHIWNNLNESDDASLKWGCYKKM